MYLVLPVRDLSMLPSKAYILFKELSIYHDLTKFHKR